MLYLKFRIDLRKLDAVSVYGPRFHRWLPNGKEDAITLPTGQADARLKVWIERRGSNKGGWIVYSEKDQTVDEETMQKQGMLQGGPLIGLLELDHVTEDEQNALEQNLIGSKAYQTLGKKVVKHLLGPSLKQLVDILRITFGQYWLDEFHKWDSRRESLGNYCQNIWLRWSLNCDGPWEEFIPDEPHVIIQGGNIGGPGDRYYEFIAQDDWFRQSQLIESGYVPSEAAFLVARAWELLQSGELRYAYVEAATAVEFAIHEVMKTSDSQRVTKAMEPFWNVPLPTQFALLTRMCNIDSGDVDKALAAIEIRNRIVHEGHTPESRSSSELQTLLRVIARCLPGPALRFPEGKEGGQSNLKMPVEDWNEHRENSERYSELRK